MDQCSASADLAASSEHDLTGKVLADKFRVLRLLGRGAIGTVYLCQQETLERLVALKVLRAEFGANQGVLARFQREAQAAARLDHPNVVRVLDFGKTADAELYVALQHVEGRDLGRVLAEDGPLSDERIVGILSQVLSALSAAHTLGLVHRDLKPENILLRSPEGTASAADQVMVSGFGVAQLPPFRLPFEPGQHASRGESGAPQGEVTGTPEYMSPEQTRGETADARSDLYSIGVLLFQLLTRAQPFAAETPMKVAMMHRFTPPPPPSGFTHVNPALETICLKALSKTREARFQTAHELQLALKAAIAPDDGRRSAAPAPRARALPVPAPRLLAVRDSSTQSLDATERVVWQPLAARRLSISLMVAGLAAGALAFAATPREPTHLGAAVRQQPSAAAAIVRPRPQYAAQPAATNALPEPSAWKPVLAPVAAASRPREVLLALATPNKTEPRRARTGRIENLLRARPVEQRAASIEQAYASDAPAVALRASVELPTAISREPDRGAESSSPNAADSSMPIASEPSSGVPAASEQMPLPAAAPPSSAPTPLLVEAFLTARTPAAVVQAAPAAVVRAAPAGARRATRASVSIGSVVTRAAVSRASARGALNQPALTRCYQAALDRAEAPIGEQRANLDFVTNMSGRIESASVQGPGLSHALRQCFEQVVRAGRVREVDTGEAKASIELILQAR